MIKLFSSTVNEIKLRWCPFSMSTNSVQRGWQNVWVNDCIKFRQKSHVPRVFNIVLKYLIFLFRFPVCNFVVHDRCSKTVVSSCSSIAAMLIKVSIIWKRSRRTRHLRIFFLSNFQILSIFFILWRLISLMMMMTAAINADDRDDKF